MTHGAVSLRLRLCDADATEAQLLRTMYAFTVSAYFMSGSWNPYGSAPPPLTYLGQLDAPLNPLAIGDGLVGSRSRMMTTAPRLPLRGSAAPIGVIDKDTVPAEPLPPPEIPAAPLSGFPVVPPPPTQ